jgi:hypothetical protein
MTLESFLDGASMEGRPKKLGVRKSLEGLPIPPSAELQGIYEAKFGKVKLYVLKFSTEEKAGNLFRLFVKKYSHALLAETAELSLRNATLPVLHRKTCCGGSYHSTLFQVDDVILLLRGCKDKEESDRWILGVLREGVDEIDLHSLCRRDLKV